MSYTHIPGNLCMCCREWKDEYNIVPVFKEFVIQG